MRGCGSTSISGSSAWSLTVWQWDCKTNVILKHAHRWLPQSNGYFYVLHTRLPRSVLPSIILDTRWMEQRVYLTATSIFPAGMFYADLCVLLVTLVNMPLLMERRKTNCTNCRWTNGVWTYALPEFLLQNQYQGIFRSKTWLCLP